MDMQSVEAAIPAQCTTCRVRHRGICAVLTPEELSRLAGQTRHTFHEPGEALTMESDEVTSYATVIDGVIKLSRVLRDGRQQLVGLQFSADLLGRLYASESPLTAERVCRDGRQKTDWILTSTVPAPDQGRAPCGKRYAPACPPSTTTLAPAGTRR